MERKLYNPNPLVQEYYAFARESQGRFLYFKELDIMLGDNANESLGENFMEEIGKAVEILGPLMQQMPIVASYATEQGILAGQICGVGADTESGFIFLVKSSMHEKPTQISMNEVTGFSIATSSII